MLEYAIKGKGVSNPTIKEGTATIAEYCFVDNDNNAESVVIPDGIEWPGYSRRAWRGGHNSSCRAAGSAPHGFEWVIDKEADLDAAAHWQECACGEKSSLSPHTCHTIVIKAAPQKDGSMKRMKKHVCPFAEIMYGHWNMLGDGIWSLSM